LALAMTGPATWAVYGGTLIGSGTKGGEKLRPGKKGRFLVTKKKRSLEKGGGKVSKLSKPS